MISVFDTQPVILEEKDGHVLTVSRNGLNSSTILINAPMTIFLSFGIYHSEFHSEHRLAGEA